jgi:hypothetical protein
VLVTAIRNEWKDSPAAVEALGITTGELRVSLGKQYTVHAVAVVRGVVLFEVIDDAEAIRWLPAWLFEQQEAAVPKDWLCNSFGGDDPQMVMGPAFVAADLASYRRMVALDAGAVSAFRARLAAEHALLAANGRPTKTASRQWLIKLTLLVGSLMIAALLAEAGLRHFARGMLALSEDERSLMYRYDRSLGWFPAPNTRALLFASRAFGVTNNSEGFRDPEHVANSKPGIVFLGDSFVWGYDVEAAERFTDKLRAKHPEWNVFNFGVSGYGTDQEYILLHRWFDDYKPRVVFLLFCEETDHEDNSSNVRYGGFYKPYCVIVGNRLELKGIPVPRGEKVFFAEHPGLARWYLARLLARGWFKLTDPAVLHNPEPTGAIIRDLQRFVNSKGAVFVMGLTRPNPRLEEFLRFFKIPYVDLSTSLRYPGFGQHWTPVGHTFVAGKIDEFLAQGKFMEASQAASRPGEGH